MSLRWIYENCEPPVVDEECSDIDDSCSDDSYDSDLMPGATAEAEDWNGNNNYGKPGLKLEREPIDSVSSPLAVADNGKTQPENSPTQRLPGEPRLETSDPARQSVRLKLFCRTGNYIGITPSGRVKGFTADNASDAHVACGVVRLQSAETGHYLAFNSTGHLYGESKPSKDNTEWEQWSTGKYESFRSHKYADAGWWLAIKNNGRHKPGPKTAWAQKATQFVTVRTA